MNKEHKNNVIRSNQLISETLEFNAYSEFDSIRFEIEFLIFFSNLHDSVRPNRTSYLPA